MRSRTAKLTTLLTSLTLMATPALVFGDDITFRLLGGTCSAATALTCWLKQVFEFSQTAILLLATAVIVFAGITYMTSAGNPKQIELSKKLILGALSGVAVIVLGKFFLVAVVGVPMSWL